MSMIWVDGNEDGDEVMQSVGFYEHTEAPLVFPSFNFLHADQDVEIPCMICGVSFHISRHRTAGEPPSAAWCSPASDGVGVYPGSQNCVQPGCNSVPRDGPGPGTSFISIRNLDSSRSEHISGPNCRSISAYHGSRISVEAMRECNTYQCLLPRDESWEPQESELEDFEKQSRYVLSGLSGTMEFNGRGYAQVFPARNNVHYPATDYNHIDGGLTGMSFHPTCFEVFKRASIYRYGFVNVKALVSWGQIITAPTLRLPEHAAVKRARQMHWMHHAGDEFLATNPCLIPGLQDILDSVQNVCNPDDICSDAASPSPNSTDMFSKFPQEIKLEILLQLDSWDIANLRLSSRTFRHLPQSLFYHLTLRELPWLYEAWTSLPLSFFVTTTAAEQQRIGQGLAEINEEILARREDDNGSEEDAAEIKRLVSLAAKLEERQKQGYTTTPVRMLDRKNTNWTQLRGELTRRWGELPGLRNRRRIWNNCQEIMGRAEIIPY
ncbi:hypothetical protein BFJ69_g8344 [Fusarium oxysporum]|uniref:F-box domain-containing protein n=1 Tax=Fusarium oxysporum TaxID=5507 RepID=A0A420N2Y8_FUSOX|nr:hypothetical protein BFJ69_g8344 [Fusarium oxysporum]